MRLHNVPFRGVLCMTMREEMRRSSILKHDLSGEIAVATVNPMKNIRSDCF